MGRNKAQSKARKKSILGHPKRKPAQPAAAKWGIKTRLYNLLPHAGFNWACHHDVERFPGLRPTFVYRIQDALKGTYNPVNHRIFDYEMGRIIARATEVEDYSILDTDPAIFWQKVQRSFVGENSFATHRRMTPATLHAFVAYALEAREANTDNRPNAWGQMVRAIEAIDNMFQQDRDAETWTAYYERPSTARWAGPGSGKDDDENEAADDDQEMDEEEDSDEDEESTKVVKSQALVGEESDEDEEMGEPMEGVAGTAVHTCQTASQHAEDTFRAQLSKVNL